MQTWLKANGGPLAIVVVGLGVGGFTSRIVGGLLIIVGLVYFVATRPRFGRYFAFCEHPLAASDASGELLVEVLQQEWRTFGQLLISALEVRVTNQTGVKRGFSGMAWQGPFMFMFMDGVSMQERRALAREEEKMPEAKARLFTPQKSLNQGFDSRVGGSHLGSPHCPEHRDPRLHAHRRRRARSSSPGLAMRQKPRKVVNRLLPP